MTSIAAAILYLWAFWLAYVLVMGLYRAHLARRMTRLMYVMAAPVLALGFLMDVLANLTVATLAFAEPPREWLVTSRLKRHVRTGTWRGLLAAWVCDTLLDVFDPTGDHC